MFAFQAQIKQVGWTFYYIYLGRSLVPILYNLNPTAGYAKLLYVCIVCATVVVQLGSKHSIDS